MVIRLKREELQRRGTKAMFRFLIGTFIVLHGLVHLWYFSLSQGLVAFKPEMGWNGHSWLFSPLLGDTMTRGLAGVLYGITTVVFVAGGMGLIAGANWADSVLIGAALLSSALIILFWAGQLNLWLEKGLIGLLINIALLVAVLVMRPSFLVS